VGDTALGSRRRHRFVCAIARAIVDQRYLIIVEIATKVVAVTDEADHRRVQVLPIQIDGLTCEMPQAEQLVGFCPITMEILDD